MSGREFEDISIPKWKFATNGVIDSTVFKIYRVFSSASEFITVEAISATDAAMKSGMTKIYMIKIGPRDDMTMLDRTMLAEAIIPDAVIPEAMVSPPTA